MFDFDKHIILFISIINKFIFLIQKNPIDMTKTIMFSIAGLLLVGLGVFSAFQVKKLNTTKSHLSDQLANIQKLEESLAAETEEKGFLSELNYELEEENQKLREKIETLQNTIRKLRKKIKNQDGKIAELQQKITQLDNNYANLKQEISILSRKDVVDNVAIQNLEQEKAEVKSQIVSFEREKTDLVAAKTITEREIEDKETSEDRFRLIVDVVNNTRVKFQSIYITKEANGRPLSRIISEGKNWKFTGVEFFMEHNQPKSILDKEFVLKIVDIDRQHNVPYIESNPAFPKGMGDDKGISYYFDGNLVEILHYNNQPKTGKNFEAQVFFKSEDGEEYLLLEGVKQFIQDGSVIGF